MGLRQFFLRNLMVVAVLAGVIAAVPGTVAQAGVPPAGFQEQIVFSGLTQPVNIEFSPDGRIFVAERRGVIKVFDNLGDTTPDIFADLQAQVHSLWDRGLLGMTLAPNFPANPWVYVQYAYDAPPGETAPYWNDSCADPNNGTCVVTGRVSRLFANGNAMVGSEQVLLSGWCQQFPSHSNGDLRFGADGALYATAGDGASFTGVDYGQLGGGSNPCADPPQEGGAMRSQDVRSTADPTTLNGALLRLDPDTGEPAADNPAIGSADANTRRIVAYGLRNPFRLTMRPGTNEVWIADNGWNAWDEVNRVISPTAGVTNFGWPCYEGAPRQSSYDAADLPLCESLYTGQTPTAPYFAWDHTVSGDTCQAGTWSSTGVAFYPGSGPYPDEYRGALFFADYSRGCIWAVKPATPGGLPANRETFVAGASSPVDLEIGPGAELYYVDFNGGTVRRLRYFAGNQPPTASIVATPTGGGLPLSVSFDGSGSSDVDPADQGQLAYAWDFTDDGSTDSTVVNPTFTYTTMGVHTARLTVTDTLGATNSVTTAIMAGTEAPLAVIASPTAGTTWRVGDTISFSGSGIDVQDGMLPPTALAWHLRLQHCSAPDNCHAHHVQDFTGASGSFRAPDHEYPSYLELELVATDSSNLTHTVVRRLDPRTVDLTFAASSPGLSLNVGSFTGQAPFTRTLIQGSTTTVSAPTPQALDLTSFTFSHWSDGRARTHVITAPPAAATLTAAYAARPLINLALNRPTTTSSACGPTETGAQAVNGSWTGGSADKWCANNDGTKWLQVDLGSDSQLNALVVRHAGAGGEPGAWNTRDFTLQVSNDATTWIDVATVTGNVADVTTSLVSVSGRYVRLNIINPSSDGNPYARVYELEVLGTNAPPPPPLPHREFPPTTSPPPPPPSLLPRPTWSPSTPPPPP